jgi:DNA primase
MDIKDIKSRLSILEVLAHYGHKPNNQNMLCCPFHPDKTPSLQIYPATNTYCCFSSNCNAGTGDAIQFIQLKENCNKHEALIKAASLLNPDTTNGTGNTTSQPAPKLFIEATPIEREALMIKLFSIFSKGLSHTKKAQDYLQSRSLDWQQIEVGYNAGTLHQEERNKYLIESCKQAGIIKAASNNKGYNTWAKDCIIFPLKNKENKIVSIYGRSTTDNKEQRHFYLQNRSGLYPGYPKPATTKLILTESVIDAASLLQQKAITDQYNILALYGTNGLTQEHIAAITEWLQSPSFGGVGEAEIILMLNADEPGEAATAKHTVTLKQLLPQINISKVTLPTGEDVNSLLQSHDDATILNDLIEQRKDFSFSLPDRQAGIENKKLEPAETIAPPALQPTENKLLINNPELLMYDNCQLHITILGGIKISGLDRMRVTLKIQHKERIDLLPVRHNLDLYHHQQTEQLTNKIAEQLQVSVSDTNKTIAQLTAALENYRASKLEALQPQQEQKPFLSEAEKQQAIKELQQKNLLQRTNALIGKSGITGEEQNRLIAYLVYCSRKRDIPLHIMFLGSSGSGKTYLQEKVSELIPQEDKIEITQVTENAFYYFKQEELKQKLILIEDMDGAEASMYPLRELQSKRRISKTVTLKDSKGNLKTITLTVEGPVCVSGCTTREKIYEDNANRCLLLYIDQGKDQDKKIMEYQTKLSAGEINHDQEQKVKQFFKNIQRVLKPITVINPYAKYMQLPEQIFKPRRTMTLLLSFIETITFYHQYQREVKYSSPAGEGREGANQPYIETTAEDIEAAFNLLKDVLFSKSDELAKATRNFLEQLKVILKQQKKESFTAKELRQQLRINPSNLKRYLGELERYGYIKGNGNRYVKYEYSITNYNEYETLKSSIDQHLQAILEKIKTL